MKPQSAAWYQPLLVRRIFWTKLRNALEEAHLAALPNWPAEEPAPGTVREFVKRFGETFAKQYDDARFGARDANRRRLSTRTYGLVRNVILGPHVEAETLAELDEAFEVYSANEELGKLALASAKLRSKLPPDVVSVIDRASTDSLCRNEMDRLIFWVCAQQAKNRHNELTAELLSLLTEALERPHTKSIVLVVAVISTLIGFDAFVRRDAFCFDYFANITFRALDRNPEIRPLESALIGLHCLLGPLEEEPEQALDQLEGILADYAWTRKNWSEKISGCGGAELVLLFAICCITARLLAALQVNFEEADEHIIAIHGRAVEIFNLIEYEPRLVAPENCPELLRLRTEIAWSQIKMRGDDADRREAIASMEEVWVHLGEKRVVGLYDIADFFNGVLICLTRCGLYNSIYIASAMTADAYRVAGALWIEEKYEDIAHRSVNEPMDDEDDRDEPTLTSIEYAPLLEILRYGRTLIE